ncbi:hypothetical protein PM3016_4331 [Paenibacillus mucilaginosus 3016]|uniref:Uncharacterized protein n=1 Tax=Paenibacillus mucilaginosus 3016 TaxID=1116391 RepID=H6NP27_9BACL|nr:hypothetical protein PM3016_4331 [Paenibacillus mucilaginosus 3016]
MKLSLQIPFTFMLLLMVMLTECSANERHYTKEDVLHTFEEQGLRLSGSAAP